MGKRLVIFMKSSEFSFPSACIYLRCPSRIPLLRASDTIAVPPCHSVVSFPLPAVVEDGLSCPVWASHWGGF